MRYLAIAVLAAALVIGAATAGSAGEYHSSGTLLCYDCHTMHFSMQHGWDATATSGPLPNTPVAGGNWIGGTGQGPNTYLLKLPANELCKSCHDGSTVAPDVVGTNANVSPAGGRGAGALNDSGGSGAYAEWKGHTLDSTTEPPGFDPTLAGFSATVYNASNGLECTNCHTQHGRPTAYRNLGPRRDGAGATFEVTYALGTTNITTRDVWIKNAGTGTPGSRTASAWNPYYDAANIHYNRNDGTLGSLKYSNKIATFCSSCHANFHGGPGDGSGTTSVGGSGSPPEHFRRHPTAQVNIGAVGGGHSNLARFVAATNKVKVATNDDSAWTNSSPICQSCHKSHGNQNPFGLIFLNRLSAGDANLVEEGGTTDTQAGIRNLCGQCHLQGN